uniref:Uncharacterized protein n=1 Tax=Anopheles culicifacies TaxID=139723 RepID=A0A182M2E9_9DIPT
MQHHVFIKRSWQCDLKSDQSRHGSWSVPSCRWSMYGDSSLVAEVSVERCEAYRDAGCFVGSFIIIIINVFWGRGVKEERVSRVKNLNENIGAVSRETSRSGHTKRVGSLHRSYRSRNSLPARRAQHLLEPIFLLSIFHSIQSGPPTRPIHQGKAAFPCESGVCRNCSTMKNEIRKELVPWVL